MCIIQHNSVYWYERKTDLRVFRFKTVEQLSNL